MFESIGKINSTGAVSNNTPEIFRLNKNSYIQYIYGLQSSDKTGKVLNDSKIHYNNPEIKAGPVKLENLIRELNQLKNNLNTGNAVETLGELNSIVSSKNEILAYLKKLNSILDNDKNIVFQTYASKIALKAMQAEPGSELDTYI